MFMIVSAATLARFVLIYFDWPVTNSDEGNMGLLAMHAYCASSRVGATRIYSEYWTCNRLIFHSQERIICSALDDQLKPGFDRYMPYRSIVKAALHPAYVLPLDSVQTTTFQREMLSQYVHYRHYVFEGYDVYQSDTNAGSP